MRNRISFLAHLVVALLSLSFLSRGKSLVYGLTARFETPSKVNSVAMADSNNIEDNNNDETMPTAVVVGAGPAGLAVSLGLAKRGWRVVLLEQHPSFEVRGASFGLHSNGRRALEELCPGIVQTRMVDTGRVLPQPQDPNGFVLPWWMLRDALLEEVRDRPTVEVRTGMHVEEIVDGGGPVTLRCASGETIVGDLVIGADGVHSTVRTVLGLPPNELTGSKVFRGTVQVNTNDNDEEDNVLTSLLTGFVPLSAGYPGIYFFVLNFHPHIQGRLCWIFSTEANVPDAGADGASSYLRDTLTEHEPDPEKLAKMLALLEASAPESLASHTATKVTDFSDAALAGLDGRWGGRKRVTLLGDAAHAMRPTDGQGGNMAFEDAVVLCRLLRQDTVRNACRARGKEEDADDTRRIHDALARFERTRLPRVKKVHDQQRLRHEARMEGRAPDPVDPEFQAWLHGGV